MRIQPQDFSIQKITFNEIIQNSNHCSKGKVSTYNIKLALKSRRIINFAEILTPIESILVFFSQHLYNISIV